MKIAFVGVKREYQKMDLEYRNFFTRFHLELPYYYANDPLNEVVVTTVDTECPDAFYEDSRDLWGNRSDPIVHYQLEQNFVKPNQRVDVVIHWRKWFPEFYKHGAINLINCQDHSFSQEWLSNVKEAVEHRYINGILCFPGWHKRNLQRETQLPEKMLLDGVTLGVDTDIYIPHDGKSPYEMLWSSDPGRGLSDAVLLALKLHQKDKRFRLNICYPDYAAIPQKLNHPALVWQGSIKNSQKLFNLFNVCGILPYTSTFKEPSSRAHRQAQAAGCLVLYPPNMGTPSELITNGQTGIVSEPSTWPDKIVELVNSGEWETIGKKAREFAVSQNWKVQADNFYNLIEKISKEINPYA